MVTTSMPQELVAIPLGDLAEAWIAVTFGGGELMVRPAEPGLLLAGTFDTDVVHRWTGPGALELVPGHHGLPWRPLRWDVGISGEIPVDLRLDTGANRSTIDLRAIRVRQLELHTGISETTILLPAAGRTQVLLACGFAAVHAQVPPAVAARIRGRLTLGAIEVDASRFPKTSDGWASPDFATAPDAVDLTVEGAFGAVRIR